MKIGAESWKRHFKAIEIGKALLIKPSWIKRPACKDQQVVILDPGLSFGTGQHATTSFCLHQIVAAVGRPSQFPIKAKNAALYRGAATPKSFLDIGTGSGILAIAAVKLGYKPVRAFDFDPECVRVASANARVNHAQWKMKIICDDVMKLSLRPKQKYDLVCANLIFQSAHRRTPSDCGTDQSHRNAGAGGHFEIRICAGANGI